MNILATLNPKQRQAVTIIRGPVLVIAGPGSGKTKCLTHRIAYLIDQGIPAQNILAVTFTNKAAQEMNQRVKKLVKKTPTIGTFHAICLKILRREIEKINWPKNFIIYDQTDQLSLIKQIIKEEQINPDQFKANTLKETISRAKDELIDSQTYQSQAQEYFPKIAAKIYQVYQTKLKKAKALDFDDLIMMTVQLFQKKPAILEKYQEKWRYLLVDEYQDINTSQYTLTNLLTKKYRNLFVIGDDSQAVYSWRGADFRNILNFEKDYPQAKVIFLEENYRSTKNILAASQQIISKNIQRKDKRLWTKNPIGPPIRLIETTNQETEANFLIEEMTELISQGLQLNDFVVLYRTNAQSRAIEEAFLKANFPYKIIGTVRFYERKEIKDILAYLKLIANPNDLVSYQRIVNLPPRNIRGIGKDGFEQLINNFRQASQKVSLTELIETIIKKVNYQQYLFDKTLEGEQRWENVQELFTVAANYHNLENFLEDVSLMSNLDEVETNKTLVNLMTLHCAKGLEFPVVFITGCEEGILPHSKSFFDQGQMEEERRLCYVGLTRAKQRVYLSFTEQRRLWGQVMVNPPSRFLADLPPDLVELRNSKGRTSKGTTFP